MRIGRRDAEQSGDFFLTAAGSQIPQLAQDEREQVSRESLAPGAPVSVLAGYETCLFVFLCSARAYTPATEGVTRQEQDPQPSGCW